MNFAPFADYGIVDSHPGPKDPGLWNATFMGGRMTNTITLLFSEEPEDRALEALLARFHGSSVMVIPPVAS